ncbi:phage minor capsid protein [Mediterraneibacter glycyrrhizinilyticus]|uniref:phage minor capsid protein n=1 Tax=Mediterraneibacter glycyrrhizinilyticus TaxID=342942 RepID=UPI0018A045C0|nr:phage minor capsid protein [Mediterraneibacter glycyrrhizinilyticus]
MRKDYKKQLSGQIEKPFSDLEIRIMEDIVRRIKQTGKITSTADWQINRLRILGYSSEDIEKMLKETLDKSYPEMFELYDKVIDWEYVRNKDIYEQINAEFIPYEENEELQQLAEGFIQQSKADLKNITQSLGFYLDYGNGNPVLTPLAEVYQKYLDAACMDIVTGAFDYNSVLRRVVTQITNSGLRQIDYASGRANRVDVAARRAVMTGVSQLTGKISDMNAEKLGTEYFEVAWHGGARPSHAVWQGKVWSKKELVTVCGLGTGPGLLGWNCYHEYYPFFPGISERNWTDEWLAEQDRKENTPKTFNGKEYTLYEAKQRQRQMETAMRAQREKVKLLEAGGADPDEVMLARAKYQGQLNEYSRFCKKMGLTEERERIYYDMRGRVATNTKMQNLRYSSDMIRNADRDSKQYYRYKNILGDDVGSLADFRRMKYNEPKKFSALKKKVDTYSDIDKKEWSSEFKQKSKDAYVRFEKDGVYLSVHALSRLPRLNKPGYPNIEESDVLTIVKGNPNYSEGESKLIFFDSGKQLVVVKNKDTDDIVSIVRRKMPKEVWECV